MKRRSLLSIAIIAPLIVACSNNEQKPNNSLPSPSPLDILHESSIVSENMLMFGDEDETDIKTPTITLDLGQRDSQKFIADNIVFLQRMLDNKKPFNVMLVDFEEKGKTDNEILISYDSSIPLAAVGAFAFAKEKRLFFDFLNMIIDLKSSQITKDEVMNMADRLELLPNIDLIGNNALSKDFINFMSENAANFTDSAPAILSEGSLWNGDVKNPVEVKSVLS